MGMINCIDKIRFGISRTLKAHEPMGIMMNGLNAQGQRATLTLSSRMGSLGSNYTILREYIKCVLPPLTEIVGPVN
jgi:uncharacterized protein YfaT (DUF1175 family)